jgi:hypothetical protein
VVKVEFEDKEEMDMPTDGLSVALTLLGGSLVFSCLWLTIRVRLNVHTRAGRSLSVSLDVATKRSPDPGEPVDR